MSLTTPTRDNRYQLPSWPPTEFTVDLWNVVFGDLADRITGREQLEASFETLMAQGIQASLDYIQVNVAPYLANLKTSIDLAQQQIDQIIIGGKAPDTLRFGGQLPAHYATALALSEGLGGKVPSSRKINNKELSADIELTKGDVGLDKVNNTADVDKPISTAQQEALNVVDGALAKRIRFDAEQALNPAQRGRVIANLDLASITGDRDLLINAGFIFINYGSKTIPAGGADFVFDRWIIGNNTNQPVTVSQILAPLGSLTSIPGNPLAKMRLAFGTAPTTGTVRILQRIESVHNLADGTASARGYFKGPAGNESLTCDLLQNFGSGGSPSSPVTIPASTQDIYTINDPTTELRRAQFVLPPLNGKTLGTAGGHFLGLSWVLTPRQTGPYEVARMSFVRGDAFYENDPFTQRLMATDRMHCLRYAEIVLAYLRYYSAGGGHIQNYGVSWTPKRTVPTATFLGLASGANLSSYGWADISADNGGRFEIVAAGPADTYALGATYRMTSEL